MVNARQKMILYKRKEQLEKKSKESGIVDAKYIEEVGFYE